jgi:hypothetical protein
MLVFQRQNASFQQPAVGYAQLPGRMRVSQLPQQNVSLRATLLLYPHYRNIHSFVSKTTNPFLAMIAAKNNLKSPEGGVARR